MIALLLASAAFAWDIDWVQCTNDDARPIAGTAGYENGLSALRTNAMTYSATQFAERELFRGWSREDSKGQFVYEIRQSYNVARVSVYQTDAEYGECPEKYRFSNRQLDLQSMNLGYQARFGRFGLYYAAGVTYGTLAEDPMMRIMLWGFGAPMATGPALIFAPLTGSWQNNVGASAFAMDWIGGLTADATVADLRVGYTRSAGIHLSATNDTLGLFGNTVVRPGQPLGQFAAGTRQTGWGKASESIGRTSVFARGLPLTEAVRSAVTGDVRGGVDQLLTGHLEQTDLGGTVDVAVAYAFAPTPLVHEAQVAVHSKGFHGRYEDGEVFEAEETAWRVQGGIVQLPAQWYYGLAGGTFPTARAELLFRGGSETESFEGVAALLFNDPEQLALFPFARNAVTLKLAIEAEF